MLNTAESTYEVLSLATLRDAPEELLTQLQRTGHAVTITVDGIPAAVLQSAEAHQRLLDIAAQANEEEGLRQGLEDETHGRTRPAREVFAEMRQRHGIPR